MQSILPKYLFRGDSDKENKRRLRSTIKSGLLLTNLCGGGNGQEIFKKTLEQLVIRHVSVGWEKTHFLSFTTEERTAIYYASGERDSYPVDIDEQWDFAIFKLDTSLFIPDSVSQLEIGVYQAEYNPVCKEFCPKYKIILIDVLSCLKNVCVSNMNSDAITNADRDKEWLILPATFLPGINELTFKLDTSCIIEKDVYCFST